jgi:hypothetical protein
MKMQKGLDRIHNKRSKDGSFGKRNAKFLPLTMKYLAHACGVLERINQLGL